jgi:hypothetical protein
MTDPFSSLVLRCEEVPETDRHLRLLWNTTAAPVSLELEMELIDVLIPFKRRERGMYCNQPEHRIRKLRRICESKHVNIRVALSLRRHHMKRLNPNLSLAQLQLGTENEVRESARLFEVAVQQFLVRHDIAFYSEEQQKAHIREHRRPGQPFPPTPDFVLQQPIRIVKYKNAGGNRRTIVEERSVCCTLLYSIFIFLPSL